MRTWAEEPPWILSVTLCNGLFNTLHFRVKETELLNVTLVWTRANFVSFIDRWIRWSTSLSHPYPILHGLNFSVQKVHVTPLCQEDERSVIFRGASAALLSKRVGLGAGRVTRGTVSEHGPIPLGNTQVSCKHCCPCWYQIRDFDSVEQTRICGREKQTTNLLPSNWNWFNFGTSSSFFNSSQCWLST